MKNNKYKIFMIFSIVVLAIAIIVSTTYAYYVWTTEGSNVTKIVFGVNTATVTFDGGSDITGNLKTSTCGSANVEKQSRTYSSGCEMFGGEDSATRKLIKWAISIIRYAIPIIIVIFGITDYLGALFSGEEKNMKEAQKKVIMRVVIGIIALLVPALIKLLVNLSGIVFNTGINSGDIFCDFI